MAKKINILTICYTLFVVLLLFSSFLDGPVFYLFYFLTFALPVALGLFMSRDDEVEKAKYLTITSSGAEKFLPFVFPTIALTMLVSFITSVVIYSLTGKTSSIDLGDSYVLALIMSALLPAIFEEALFRYLPLRLLAPHSEKTAIFVSAFFFSLVHLDLFTIPYAFVGGATFMFLDIVTGSIVPSIIIHFLNNALSVTMYFLADSPIWVLGIYAIVFLLTVISIMIICAWKEKYKDSFLTVLNDREKIKIPVQMILFAVLAIVTSILSLR